MDPTPFLRSFTTLETPLFWASGTRSNANKVPVAGTLLLQPSTVRANLRLYRLVGPSASESINVNISPFQKGGR